MDPHRFLALDLGAESGRAIVGTLRDGRLSLEEISRFPNEPVEIHNSLQWDILALHNNILKALREYVRRYGDAVEGVGIDTWGVDFGLLSKSGELLHSPVHYRDPRTRGMMEEAGRRIAPEDLFRRTGMTLFPINTSLQLLSMRVNRDPILDSASTLLMIPDLLAYFLTGRKCCERTNAATTQLYNPWQCQWDEEVIRKLDLPLSLLPEIIDPGTILGDLLDSVHETAGLKTGVAIAPCTHDTASAVAAVPAQGKDWAFLSCGTWSVVGALTTAPVTSSEAFAAGVFNELTLQSHFLCRNIMGLWLLQQARAIWEREGNVHSYEELVKLAREAPEGGPLINPNDPLFLAPQDMPKSIGEYCARTGQRVPHGPGETTRCILESLALAHRHAVDRLAHILNRRFSVLHIVGGGSKSSLLCQITANATGLPVIAGPSEATVAGNLMVQALAKGCVSTPEEIREVVRISAEPIKYEPQDARRYEERYGQYLRHLGEAPT